MNHNNRLYRADQVRELDRQAIEVQGIDGYALMNRAGARAFATLRARWPEARAITVCCGGGNNGGDGYVIARLAREAGLGVQLIAMKAPEDLSGDAARAARDFEQSGGKPEPADERLRGDVIVDALLGTGLDRPVCDDYARLIEHVNDAGCPVLAVDVPSGLNADTGMPLGACVRADVIVTFIGRKRGLHTGQAGRWCGAIVFDGLDTPDKIHDAIDADARLLDAVELFAWLPPRRPDTHKGDLGHVLIVGGDAGMSGAPALAGSAALRTGSGLVSIATRLAHAATLPVIQPVMGEGNPGADLDPEFYTLARELTHRHGTLLLVDSIQAGLRSQGVLSIVDYPGFEGLEAPDMETYSKALNAGQYPLSVLAMNERAAGLYRKGVYGNTMTANPRALDVGSTVLEQITPELRANIVERGREFLDKFSRLKDELDGRITRVQGTGLLFSVELDSQRYKAYGEHSTEEYLRLNGINVIHGGENSLRYTPTFGITSAEVDLIVKATRDALLNGPVRQSADTAA